MVASSFRYTSWTCEFCDRNNWIDFNICTKPFFFQHAKVDSHPSVVFGSMLNNLLKVVPILVIRDGSKYYPITQISFNDSNQTVLKGKEETLH